MNETFAQGRLTLRSTAFIIPLRIPPWLCVILGILALTWGSQIRSMYKSRIEKDPPHGVIVLLISGAFG